MTETNETKKGNGLAIASFVLALVWGFLCITIIGGVLWVICWILSIIFWIVALTKKQTKRASILWIIFSLIWVAIVVIFTTVIWKFIVQHKDQLINPISEFSTRVEKNPDFAKLMENEEFSDKFEEIFEKRLQEKYWNEYSDINDVNGLMTVWWDLFEEMKDIVTDLAGQEWINENEEPIVWIANPAAEFCAAQGWESYIVEDEDWSQRWMCRLSDGNEVDEWEYYRENINLEPEINSEETSSKVTVCDEFYKSGEEIVCTEQYEPVCGDNGQTYGNSCFACIEANSYTNWECTEVKEITVKIGTETFWE